MNKAYTRINWENYPSEATPLNETNLNKIDYAVDEIDNRVISLDTAKLDKTTANGMVKNVAFDTATGIFTITYLNGSTSTLDTKLEKLAVNFTYDSANERLIITLDDSTEQYVDLSSLITEYEFENTGAISFTVENGKVKANINNGAVTGDMLQPNYLADVTVQAGIAQQGADNAENSASAAEASAVRAEEAAERAENVTDISIATNEKAGIVKGNVNEISIAVDGKMSVTSSFTPQEELTEVTGTENKMTLFGKIAKAVSDLIAHIANTSIHFSLTNNLLSTIPGTALDAVQGKELDTRVTANTTDIATLNSKLPQSGYQIRIGSTEITCAPNATSTLSVSSLILNAFGWTQLYMLVPVLSSSIPSTLFLSYREGVIYVYNNSAAQYDNVPILYIAIGK